MSEKVIGEIQSAHKFSAPVVPFKKPAPALRPAITQVLDFVDESLNDSVRTNNSLSFEGRMGPTTVIVRPVETQTIGVHRALETVTISTDVTRTVGLPVQQVAIANRFAALAALVKNPATGNLSLETRLTTFEGFDGSLEFYKHVLACAALNHDQGLATAINKIFSSLSKVRWEGACLPGCDDEDQWSAEEFEVTAALLIAKGYFASAGRTGLIAEIPWEASGGSACSGHSTNQLMFSAPEKHPTLGRGLYYKLELSPTFPLAKIAELGNDLNLFERDAVDGPPLFGAWWAMQSSGRLAYVGFWPNVLHYPNLLEYVAIWLIWRSRIVCELIENGRV